MRLIIRDVRWESDFLGHEVFFDDIDVVSCYTSDDLGVFIMTDSNTNEVISIEVMTID